MAYSLFSRNYDIGLKNSVVTISNKWTGVPAVILEGPGGGIVSAQGVAQLDNQANLNVYIDTAQEWTIRVMDGQVLEYNVQDPKKIVSVTDLQNVVPERGVTYVLDHAPFTEYVWDGENLINSISASQTTMVENLADTQISNVQYTVGGKISSYTRSGVEHSVDYPDANTYIFSNTTGVTKIVTLDNNGNVISII